MRITILLLVILVGSTSLVFAASKATPGDLPELPLESLYFGGENPVLTPSEQKALKIARDWQARSATQLTPVPGPDGAIRFLHGSVQPSIVCAVMQVTDIELEPGEQINNISIGDSARWLVEPAVTGAGVAEVQHIILKPMDVGLETSLIVITNRPVFSPSRNARRKKRRRTPSPKPKNTLEILTLLTGSAVPPPGNPSASTTMA